MYRLDTEQAAFEIDSREGVDGAVNSVDRNVPTARETDADTCRVFLFEA